MVVDCFEKNKIGFCQLSVPGCKKLIRRGDVNKRCQLALSGVWWFWKFGSGQRCHHRIQKWSFHVFMIFLDFLQDFHTKYWILQKSWRKPKKINNWETHVHLDSETQKLSFYVFLYFLWFSSGFPHKILDFAEIVKKTKKI